MPGIVNHSVCAWVMIRYALFGGLLLIVQICCAIHAGRRGRYWWIWIVLFFPLAGSVAYAILYWWPDFRHSHALHDTGKKIADTIQPTREIERLRRQVAFSDTTANRQKLAHEYMRIGLFKEAIAEYGQCLQGAFKDDVNILACLAEAHYMNETYAEARDLLVTVREKSQHLRNKGALLLLAIVHEELEEYEQALSVYESIVAVYPGEEPRCRYALLLKRMNDPVSAEKNFREILIAAGNSPRYYRKTQKKWIDIARQNLEEMKTQPA